MHTTTKIAIASDIREAVSKYITLNEDELKEQTLKTYNHVKDNYSRAKVLDIYRESLRHIN